MDLNYFCSKNSQMAAISEIPYKNLALILLSRVEKADYFSGTIELDTEEYHSILRVTIIVYRETFSEMCDKTFNTSQITDIVPVWWEYDTFQECGQVPNDFSWSEFRKYLF